MTGDDHFIRPDNDTVPTGTVAALRKNIIHGDGRLYNPAGHNPLMMRAADLLEELTAECLKLSELSDVFHAALQQIATDDGREECCGNLQHSGCPYEEPQCCGRPTHGFERAQEVAMAAIRAVIPAQVEQLDDPLSVDALCEGCPPVDYPTDRTRCLPCPRRPTNEALRASVRQT